MGHLQGWPSSKPGRGFRQIMSTSVVLQEETPAFKPVGRDEQPLGAKLTGFYGDPNTPDRPGVNVGVPSFNMRRMRPPLSHSLAGHRMQRIPTQSLPLTILVIPSQPVFPPHLLHDPRNRKSKSSAFARTLGAPTVALNSTWPVPSSARRMATTVHRAPATSSWEPTPTRRSPSPDNRHSNMLGPVQTDPSGRPCSATQPFAAATGTPAKLPTAPSSMHSVTTSVLIASHLATAAHQPVVSVLPRKPSIGTGVTT